MGMFNISLKPLCYGLGSTATVSLRRQIGIATNPLGGLVAAFFFFYLQCPRPRIQFNSIRFPRFLAEFRKYTKHGGTRNSNLTDLFPFPAAAGGSVFFWKKERELRFERMVGPALAALVAFSLELSSAKWNNFTPPKI